MGEVIKSYKVSQISNYKKECIVRSVVVELALEVFVNNDKVTTFFCTPKDEELLAVGFLQYKGLIENAKDINRIDISKEKGQIRIYTKNKTKVKNDFLQGRIITSAKEMLSFINKGDPNLLGRYSLTELKTSGREKSNSSGKVSLKGIRDGGGSCFLTPKEIITLMSEFEDKCLLYEATHGVHEAAIATKKGILFFYEDIGRQNAIDKVFGKCLMEGIDTKDKILITSGRISSEMMFKIIRRNISVVVSEATPTDIAILLAKKLAINLIGFIPDETIVIYNTTF